MKNQWEVWTSALSSEQCDYIIQKGLFHKPQSASVGFELDSNPDDNIRTSIIRWMDVLGRDSDISNLLMRFVSSSNRTNFGFDITSMNEIQFTEYHGSNSGKYDWHHDVHWENSLPYDRKLSIVVQLSDPRSYSGGDFEFFGIQNPGDLFKSRGSILVFPSFFLHRVLPVTSGTRYSLVSWIEGPKFR